MRISILTAAVARSCGLARTVGGNRPTGQDSIATDSDSGSSTWMWCNQLLSSGVISCVSTPEAMFSRRPLRRLTAQINCAYASAAGGCSCIRQSNFKRQPLSDEEALRMATASLVKLLYPHTGMAVQGQGRIGRACCKSRHCSNRSCSGHGRKKGRPKPPLEVVILAFRLNRVA